MVPSLSLRGEGAKPAGACEVADVFHLHGASYAASHPLSLEEKSVIRDILRCRTAALGGRLYQCNRCGYECPVYNSCRNRHCPKCQTLTKEEWLEARRAELLPVPYFHNVFTLPHELNALALANRTLAYNILFRAAPAILLHFGRHRLHGTIGIIAILHTWDQKLNPHIHLHCLVPGGALSFDGQRWHQPLRPNFLFDVRELSRAFRDRYLAFLQQAYDTQQLFFPPHLASLSHPDAFRAFFHNLSTKDWVVYSKPTFSTAEKTLDYLGRYTHRVAISNHRLLHVDSNAVAFTYRDRKAGGIVKDISVHPHEFIQRFLSHTLPFRFHRIRSYGLYANRPKNLRLRQALAALGHLPHIEPPPQRNLQQKILALIGIDITLCPVCQHGTMNLLKQLAGHRSPLSALFRTPADPHDTS